MAPADRAARCVANNLHLCGAVLAPHGISGAIADGIWTCTRRLPPYYPNAITLSPDGAPEQARAIRQLAFALARPFAVKDSFAALDLAPHGFRALFSAEWIWRDAGPAPVSDRRWRQVATPDDLAAWEAAWNDGGSPADTRVFLPALLDDDTVRIFATERDGRIAAGCIANRSGDVVGFSNFFTTAPNPQADLVAALATIADAFPGFDIVGYDQGAMLDAMIALDFECVGPLRIWLSPQD